MKMDLVKLTSATVMLLVAGLFFQSCAPKGTPIIVLGTPRFVPQSQPDSAVETGIGQDPNTGGIFLQWYSTEGATGFKVYRSDTKGTGRSAVNFSTVSDVAVNSALSDTSTVDVLEVQIDTVYYYYLKAYNSLGTLSGPSDTISYALLQRPTLTYPTGNETINGANLQFNWKDFTAGGYAVIRVVDLTVFPNSYVWISKRFQSYGGSETYTDYNFDGNAVNQLSPGHSYEWRVDRFNLDGTGRPYEGARSVWGTFTVK